MARRSHHSDLVTIVYPPGCREVTEDLGSDELIRRLKTLAHTFQTLTQAEDESTYADYTPLAIHLADEHYLNHASRDVQLLVACCVADILRIFAPEAPYKDPAQIKTIFFFLIKQLGGLKDPKDPAFKRYFYLLENLAYVKSFNMCFDLEECSEIFCALFQLMFKIVNDEHSGKVKSFMLDVLTPLINEADFVSNELLDIIMQNIVEPVKTQRKNAYSLAQDLIIKTSTTLEPYIQQFFNQVLILGKADASLSISRKVYDLIYELNHICPKILLTVLPQLEFKLKSTEEAERMGSVSLLARMFSERNSSLAQKHRQLWLAFLGRYNDISVAIRIKCVQYTMHFLLNHPELITDITDTLKMRQHDAEENVRYEVVMAIVKTAEKNFDVVSRSEELLNFVKERTLDKKFKIRKEAMCGLALIYKKHLSDPQNVPEATKQAVTWIKDKILHGYYMSGMEDRLLVERLMNTRLVPYNLESSERMKKLFLLFGTIDENASKAFIEVQKHQLQVRKCVSELVALHRLQPAEPSEKEKRDKEIAKKLQATARFLPDHVKSVEFLKKLSQHMFRDKLLLDWMEKVVDENIGNAECMTNVSYILKKLGSPIMTNLYYGTVKQLLERVSSVMVDREAIGHLAIFVKDALQGGPILEELGLDSEQGCERGLRLLLVLAFVFPAHFLDDDIIRELMSFLSLPYEEGSNAAPLTLSILTFIGKHRPLGDAFPALWNVLAPICKQFVDQGTPKEAKQAVKCLHMNATRTMDVDFAELLDIVKRNLDPEKGETYLTAIVSLGHIALNLPAMFPVQIKNLVSRKIVKELLMKDRTEARADDDEDTWVEMDELPLETRSKLEGLKMMARWLIGLKDDSEEDKNNSVTISAQKTFRVLNAIIDNKGDLLEEKKPSRVERAWFRLSAGCAILKICEQKGVGDKYTLEQFYTLSTLFVDEVPQVRERILTKLHKGLGRGVPNKCLPLDFMGLYALCGLETEKKLRLMAKQYMVYDINKRKEFIKTQMMSGAADRISHQMKHILPDYMLVFAVSILTHWDQYTATAYDDVETLKRIQVALWFVLESLMSKNENFSFGFYKALVERMKTKLDKLRPEDDDTNHRLWAVCDLVMGLLLNKTTSYELKEFPTELELPAFFFKEHADPYFANAICYLPAELMPKTSKRPGLAANYLAMHQQPKKTKGPKSDDVTTKTTVIVTTEQIPGVSGDQQLTKVEQGAQIIVQCVDEANGAAPSSSAAEAAAPPPRKRGRPPASAAAAAVSSAILEQHDMRTQDEFVAEAAEPPEAKRAREGAAKNIIPETSTEESSQESTGRLRRTTRR